ncbi:MAG: 4Fe-4S binding protein [Synergistales bacterium]|nr:4Fe-4S binding protein [Synergistales bacterium]
MMEMLTVVLRNLLSKPMTVPFPDEAIPFADKYRGRHLYELEKCVSCSLCARVCPNRAIVMVQAPEGERERYPRLYPEVDFGKCCFCGLCQDICPTGALTLSRDVFLSTFDPDRVSLEPFPPEREKGGAGG